MLLMINGEEIVGTFYEKELQKTNQKNFWMDKAIRKKEASYISNGKITIIHLIAQLIKRMLYKNTSIFIFLNHMNLSDETLMSK